MVVIVMRPVPCRVEVVMHCRSDSRSQMRRMKMDRLAAHDPVTELVPVLVQ